MTQARPLNQVAYEQIYAQVVSGRVSASERVSEHHFARQLNMSRTPIREAIRRLTNEGVFYQVPRSGTYLAAPSRKRIREGYEMRMELESAAAAKAADRLTGAQLDELADRAQQMRQAVREFRDLGVPTMPDALLIRFATADVGFHRLILRAADNRLIDQAVSQLLLQKQAFSFPTGRGAGELRPLARVCGFHALIARALRRRDADAARRWMRAHLRDSCRRALEGIDQQADQSQRATGQHPSLDLDALLSQLIGARDQTLEKPAVIARLVESSPTAPSPPPFHDTPRPTPAGPTFMTGNTRLPC